MTSDLKIVSAALVSLLICGYTAAYASQNEDGIQHTTEYRSGDASKTLSETLIVSTPDTSWTRKNHSLITLTKGNLIVIAGKQPVVIKTAAGEADIPAGLAAMVQQESDNLVCISMIGVRGKVANPNSNNWDITVTAADRSVYKLGFGDVLLSASGKDNNDAVVIQQPPAARKIMREAAHQLNCIVLALDVNGVLLADKIANDCTGTLLSLTQGSVVSVVPEQLKRPVNIFVDDGNRFVAVQPGSIYQRPTAATLVAARKQ